MEAVVGAVNDAILEQGISVQKAGIVSMVACNQNIGSISPAVPGQLQDLPSPRTMDILLDLTRLDRQNTKSLYHPLISPLVLISTSHQVHSFPHPIRHALINLFPLLLALTPFPLLKAQTFNTGIHSITSDNPHPAPNTHPTMRCPPPLPPLSPPPFLALRAEFAF